MIINILDLIVGKGVKYSRFKRKQEYQKENVRWLFAVSRIKKIKEDAILILK